MNRYITFNVERNEKAGILVADWQDLSGPNMIITEDRDIFKLQMKVKKAVIDYFEPGQTPESVLLYLAYKAAHIPIGIEPRPQ